MTLTPLEKLGYDDNEMYELKKIRAFFPRHKLFPPQKRIKEIYEIKTELAFYDTYTQLASKKAADKLKGWNRKITRDLVSRIYFKKYQALDYKLFDKRCIASFGIIPLSPARYGHR